MANAVSNAHLPMDRVLSWNGNKLIHTYKRPNASPRTVWNVPLHKVMRDKPVTDFYQALSDNRMLSLKEINVVVRQPLTCQYIIVEISALNLHRLVFNNSNHRDFFLSLYSNTTGAA